MTPGERRKPAIEFSYHILDKTRESHGTDTSSLGSEVVLLFSIDYNKKTYRETAPEFIL
jgi:hypothetical protein